MSPNAVGDAQVFPQIDRFINNLTANLDPNLIRESDCQEMIGHVEDMGDYVQVYRPADGDKFAIVRKVDTKIIPLGEISRGGRSLSRILLRNQAYATKASPVQINIPTKAVSSRQCSSFTLPANAHWTGKILWCHRQEDNTGKDDIELWGRPIGGSFARLGSWRFKKGESQDISFLGFDFRDGFEFKLKEIDDFDPDDDFGNVAIGATPGEREIIWESRGGYKYVMYVDVGRLFLPGKEQLTDEPNGADV